MVSYLYMRKSTKEEIRRERASNSEHSALRRGVQQAGEKEVKMEEK